MNHDCSIQIYISICSDFPLHLQPQTPRFSSRPHSISASTTLIHRQPSKEDHQFSPLTSCNSSEQHPDLESFRCAWGCSAFRGHRPTREFAADSVHQRWGYLHPHIGPSLDCFCGPLYPHYRGIVKWIPQFCRSWRGSCRFWPRFVMGSLSLSFRLYT